MSDDTVDFDPARALPVQKKSIANSVLSELGLIALWNSPRDVKLLCAQRYVRAVGYGLSTLILVAYLDALGNNKTEIGFFMTLTLVGDTCISFFLTLFADALGRKATLALGALLMAASGAVFALFGTYWILLIAAIVGVISPNGNEIGPFRAIEESIIAHLTVPDIRSDLYAWYNLCGLAGAASGLMISGWVLQLLTETLHWDLMKSYRTIFLVYGAIGVFMLCLTLILSHSIESEKRQQKKIQTPMRRDETTPLLNGEPGDRDQAVPSEAEPKGGLRVLLPNISRDSAPIVIVLCFLYGLNAFGSSVIPLSWTTYYFQWRFDVEKGQLGSIFFVSQILAAMSMIVASSISKRLGNVKTMVLTHLPSQFFRAVIGLPNNMHVALLLYILHASTNYMSTAPRSALIATLVLPEERTAVMGTLNVVKTAASSLGPTITGTLVDHNLFWVSFLLSGSLKALYDIGMLVFFRQKEREKSENEQSRIREQENQTA
ncbi:major facilitator superfamily domain-containing protein [Xylaria bambusicola]|uniref:major facilitator superfamily domain-containing protein n=1 Tax=Xylaria bambusicola TaxID=326684 RepID=UPI00200869E7|nr:major facilitator superfamily domain-containing protein [Xylaria bambusicola]KAI0514983.1 major facilitator superfamily domain-containing protein [Xylaria bambusicola]